MLGWNVRRLRVASGRTVEALAWASEIDPSLVGRIERGTANPTLAVIDKLAKGLDVQIADLFERLPAGAKPPKPLAAGRRPASK